VYLGAKRRYIDTLSFLPVRPCPEIGGSYQSVPSLDPVVIIVLGCHWPASKGCVAGAVGCSCQGDGCDDRHMLLTRAVAGRRRRDHGKAVVKGAVITGRIRSLFGRVSTRAVRRCCLGVDHVGFSLSDRL